MLSGYLLQQPQDTCTNSPCPQNINKLVGTDPYIVLRSYIHSQKYLLLLIISHNYICEKKIQCLRLSPPLYNKFISAEFGGNE